MTDLQTALDAMRWAPYEMQALPSRTMDDWPALRDGVDAALGRQDKALKEYQRLREAQRRLG